MYWDFELNYVMDKIKALSKNHIDQNRVNREPSVLA